MTDARLQSPTGRGPEMLAVQSEEVEAALKAILPKPYTGMRRLNVISRPH